MTLETFINENWPLLLVGMTALIVLFTLFSLSRSRQQIQELLESSRQQALEQERSLNQQLMDTREDMLTQVGRGQRAEQKALLMTSNRIFQGIQQRFGEINASITRDNGELQTQVTEKLEKIQRTTSDALGEGKLTQQQAFSEFRRVIENGQQKQREQFEERQAVAQKSQQETLSAGMASVNKQVNEALLQHGEVLGKRVQGLTETTDQRLKEISGQVENRLAKGFEKTTETFTQVLTHLTRIDEAQKKLNELSSNVVGLQELLSDKRSRGAFGEIQLNALVRNLMPEGSVELQYTMSNGTRADCLLRLPDPTGDIAIDAKFPLESYQNMTDLELPQSDRERARRQFQQDIKKHISDISSKYIIPGETSDGAMMFIPAEAVFAEIHAHHPGLVEEAQRKRVWMVSPTTMMAVLTTARTVLRDAATQKQVHVIREHLHALSADFGRFQERMDKLSQHIAQAHKDVDDVHVSARKITNRFDKIEQVQLEDKCEEKIAES